MNEEAVVAQNQHYVSGNNLVVRCAFNREQIAWPYRGEPCWFPMPLTGAGSWRRKRLGRQPELKILAISGYGWHRWPHPYEFIRWNLR